MTDIKDVIHFYLGCEIEITQDGETERGTLYQINADGICEVQNGDDLNWYEIKDIKPCLRPLYSMTEEERDECGIGSALYPHLKSGINNPHFFPQQFAWLLKNSFDLFGLCESNQAIDKTKL